MRSAGLRGTLEGLAALLEAANGATTDAALGAAALASTRGEEAAVRELHRLTEVPRRRAMDAVRAGRSLPMGSGSGIVERLSGIRFPDAMFGRFVDLADCAVDEVTPASAPKIGGLLAHAASGDWSYVTRRLSVDDYPTRLAVAMLTASYSPSAADLQPLLRSCGNEQPTKRDVEFDRAVAALYLASTYGAGQLGLGTGSWGGASPAWRADASPWVLSAVNFDDCRAMECLLEEARSLGLTVVHPGVDPLDIDATGTWYSGIRDRAASCSELLVKEPMWPIWFEDPSSGVQILMAADDDYVVAWVGRQGRGLIVSFDIQSYTGFHLVAAGARAAVGLAIAWYVDCTIKLPGVSGSPRNKLFASTKTGLTVKYVPTKAFLRQVHDVGQGIQTPPRAHRVAAFVRHLEERSPNPAHVAQAPKRLRRLMGPQDTWVRAHARGNGTSTEAVKVRLSRYSALADALGTGAAD